MTPENEMSLVKTVAKLEERLSTNLEQNKNLDAKLDLILGKMVLSDSERYADLHSFRFSLKKKINESTNKLKEYHDNDLKALKEDIGVFIWFGKNKKYLITLGLIILISFADKLHMVYISVSKKYGL